MKKTILIVLLLVVQSSFSQIIMASFQGALSSKIAVVVPKTIVTIGTQVWTTKNLDVATYRDGTKIPEVQDPIAWEGLTTGAWCYHNNDSNIGATYGKLYNWYAVAGIHDEASKIDASKRKKLAPTGFHVPIDTEWTTLTNYLDGESVAGGKMKETGTEHWLNPNNNATNISGFTGLPGGIRIIEGFRIVGINGFWWSSTEVNNNLASYIVLHLEGGNVNFVKNLKTSGSSVRCVKNTVPNAPTITDATAGNKEATVSFTAPASDGGSAITEYTVTSFPGGFKATRTTSPIIVSGLTNGTSYYFAVVATNAVGNSVPSAVSLGVTPAISVSSAPTSPVATAGYKQASVAFTAPASDGGSAITGYTVTSTPGGFKATRTTSPIVVSGLTNGTSYTFTVVATNVVGNSVASAASNAVTPASVPDAPTSPVATAGNKEATVSFTAPASEGGSTITSYTVTSSPASSPATFTDTTSPIVVTGLTNGTSYTFTVVATNAVGNSVSSADSNAVTPAISVSSAPKSPVATAGYKQASIAFTAPVSVGGSAITGYTVTSTPGNFTATETTSPIVVTGLTNGISYTFTVVATNAVGDSAASTASDTVTPAATIGLHPELGGYVFYVTPDGLNGLVSETQDQGMSDWYNVGALVSNPENHSVAGKKFADWRVPTIDEFTQMYNSRIEIGGFSGANCWSSTVFDSTLAYFLNFNFGKAYPEYKHFTLNVRGVRAF